MPAPTPAPHGKQPPHPHKQTEARQAPLRAPRPQAEPEATPTPQTAQEGTQRATQPRKRAPRGSGTVVKLGNGYQARITVKHPTTGEKLQITGYGPTPTAAIARRTHHLQGLYAGTWQPRKLQRAQAAGTHTAGQLTLAGLLEEWKTARATDPNIKLQTTLQHERTLTKWVTGYLTQPAQQLTRRDIETHLKHKLTELGAGPSARENSFRALRALLRWAVKEEHLATNPMEGIQSKDYVVKQAAVSRDDQAHIGKRLRVMQYFLRWLASPTCPPQYAEHRLLVEMMLLGLRRAEILGLDWTNIHNLHHKDKATLTVRQQLMRAPDGTYHIQDSTKTKKDRVIPLPEEYRKLLLARKKENRGQHAPTWAKDLVFLTPTGNIITYKAYNNAWRDTLTAYWRKDNPNYQLKPSDLWRPHSNRKLTATLLAERGTPITTVVALLGHSSEAMTFYYAQVSETASRAAMNTLAQAITTTSTKKPAQAQEKPT